MKNEPYIPTTYDALQVFTLVILEASLLTQDALRRIIEYKVVIQRSQKVSIGIYRYICSTSQ